MHVRIRIALQTTPVFANISHLMPAFLPSAPLLSCDPSSSSQSSKSSHSPFLCALPSPSRRAFLRHLLNSALLLSSLPSLADPSESPTPPLTDIAPSPSPPPPPPRIKPPKRPIWGYSETDGPEVWSTLSPDFSLLSTGLEQSPVALSYRSAVIPSTPRPTLTTNPGKVLVRLREVRPGAANRSVIVSPYIPPPPPLVGDAPPVDTYTAPPPLAVINEGGNTWVFREMHLHGGTSEHVIDGVRGACEVHVVFERRKVVEKVDKVEQVVEKGETEDDEDFENKEESSVLDNVVPQAQAADGDVANTLVVALLGVQAEKSRGWVQRILEVEKGEDNGVILELDIGKVLKGFSTSPLYNYMGSLTTPPGTEGISWLVMAQKMGIAKKEVDKLVQLQGGSNVRPLQELNNRKIFRYPPARISGD